MKPFPCLICEAVFAIIGWAVMCLRYYKTEPLWVFCYPLMIVVCIGGYALIQIGTGMISLSTHVTRLLPTGEGSAAEGHRRRQEKTVTTIVRSLIIIPFIYTIRSTPALITNTSWALHKKGFAVT